MKELLDDNLALLELALLDRFQNRKEEARKEYEEALLQTYRELAQKNPETYLPYVALTLNNLALLDSDPKEARKEYEEALQTYRELAQKNPETYLPYVASTLTKLGILDRFQNRKEEARKEYAEALQIYEAFAKRDSEQFSPLVKKMKELLDDKLAKKLGL
jgi:tetratricopeptide (TPR) repeat protein